MLIQPIDSPLTDWDQVAMRVSQVQGVRLAAPVVEGQALASSPFNANGVLVRGIRGADFAKLGSIANNIKQGTLDGFDQGQGIAIGRRLADQLSLQVGDNLTLVSPRGAVTPMGTTPRIKPYRVVAIFEIGMSEYDAAFVFMPLREAQAYFNRAGDVTAIEVYVDNPDHILGYRKPIADAAQRPIYMIDWRQRNATFFGALQVERDVMFMILTLIVLVAALSILSALIMLVKDKTQNIAILRTMGASQGAVNRHGYRRHRHHDGIRGRHRVLRQHRKITSVPVLAHQHRAVSAGAIFPLTPAGRNGFERNDRRGGAGFDLVVPGDALSVLAGSAARSGRSVAQRVIECTTKHP